MATKTERIMSYLPGTFKAAQTNSPLKAVVDTFGTELLNAENSLAALMRAHWVDHADKGAPEFDDLDKLAALYGLAPRADEDIEEFREHLKKYVKTLLEGTVTVQGMLRITANNLGLTIEDRYDEMDSWWSRDSDNLVRRQRCGQDASPKLFAEHNLESIGKSERPAQITGTVKLDEPVDLTSGGQFSTRTLKIKLNNKAKVTVDIFSAVSEPTAANISEIIQAINSAFSAELATLNNGYLVLTALSSGSDSKIYIEEHPSDGAPLLLGLLPHIAKGKAAVSAKISSPIDLSGTNNLTNDRYLRIRVDETHLAEIDCAGDNPAATTLDEIRDAINAALPISIASHDGHFLSLESTRNGGNSSIVFLQAAAQDGVNKLFGAPPTVVSGHDKLAAQLVSTIDLRNGVDLSESFNLRIIVNTSSAVNVDCRGLEPSNSQLPEIVNIINDTLGKNVASHNGRNLILTSTTQSAASRIMLEHAEIGDALPILFGIYPRTVNGYAATSAKLTSHFDWSAGRNLFSDYRLRVSVDHQEAIDIDLSTSAADKKEVTLDELVNAINIALDSNTASHDNHFLTLKSNIAGNVSSLKVLPIEKITHQRFVSRAKILNEASDKIFGFNEKIVTGQDSKTARVVGAVSHARGIDLRSAQYLVLQINQEPPITINCAGPRPRATQITEVITNINAALGQKVAVNNNGFISLVAPLPLVSSQKESISRIEFHSPTITDALDTLLSVPVSLVRGSDARGVSFTATSDLSSGVDLSINHTIKLKIDNDGPLEINCSGLNPSQTSLAQIAIAINIAFSKNYASHDGTHLLLTSLLTGSDSILEIQTPSTDDATALILGVSSPRTYQGTPAAPAKIIGNVDLSGDNTDLNQRQFLQLAIDGLQTQTINCAKNAINPNAVTRTEIIDAINESIGLPIASESAGFLVLTSPTSGLSSRINLQLHTGSDARQILFGDVNDVYEGAPATNALLQGKLDLRSGIDLSERNQLAIAFDGNSPINIYIKAATPTQAFAEEIADAINQRVAGVAKVSATGTLELKSPSQGSQSSVAILPVRYLELQEYLPRLNLEQQQFEVRHGTRMTLLNPGVSPVSGELSICAPNGIYGAGVINLESGWQLRVLASIEAGEKVTIRVNAQTGLEAIVSKIDAGAEPESRVIGLEDLLVGPLLPQMHVPTKTSWYLAKGRSQIDGIVINNSLAPNILQLQSQLENSSENRSTTQIKIKVIESNLNTISHSFKYRLENSSSEYRFIGRLRKDKDSFILEDASGEPLVKILSAIQLELSYFANRAVVIIGELISEAMQSLDELLVTSIALLFDVTLFKEGATTASEFYPAVTIGESASSPFSFEQQLIFGQTPSKLARAFSLEKSAILKLEKGKSSWCFVECDSSRFNVSHFSDNNNHFSRFSGGISFERGLIGISNADYQPPQRLSAAFAGVSNNDTHINYVDFNFQPHMPGTMRVNLPADLSPRFGGRFNEAIFGVPGDKPEVFEQVVTEPESDPNNLVKRVNEESLLLKAKHVDFVPIGFSAIGIPFAKAAAFTLGSPTESARLFLSEQDVPGFIELSARKVGRWGNQLSIIVCDAGPAIFDLMISYPGSRFENARQAVLGDKLTAVVNESLKPGPFGVMQAKAAGTYIEVTRSNCEL